MKLRDVLGKFIENKRTKQEITVLKKKKLKEVGISKEELLNMKIDKKLNKLLFEDE